jgi:VanZ family protein
MKLSLRQIIYYRVLLCISLVVITYLATTALEITIVSSSYDKLNHFLAFLVLALLVDFSFPNSRFNTDKIFLLIAYGFSLEVVQHFLPHRMFSFFDIAADSLGLLAYGLLIPLIKRIPGLSERWANE